MKANIVIKIQLWLQAYHAFISGNNMKFQEENENGILNISIIK